MGEQYEMRARRLQEAKTNAEFLMKHQAVEQTQMRLTEQVM